MTPDDFSKELPPITNNLLPFEPPYLFNGVSARVFPLRASLVALQQLCDRYLNFIPSEAGCFRAVVPYTYLVVLDYGEMSEKVAQIGWFAQLEVLFGVPVEWYKLVNGRWVFHDWAVITPYIFVNDTFSMPLGRTIYGYPKVLAQVTSAPSQWVKNPVAPVTLARVETAVFPEAYADERLQTKVFLEIEREAPMSNIRVPPDLIAPMMPWVVASNFAAAMGGFGRDAMWLAQSMRIFHPNPGTIPAAVPEMLSRLEPVFAPGGQGFVLNSLNLKQFRRADEIKRICYQSLTNGPMRTTGVNGGGLLGEQQSFLGDLSGGHTIKMYQHSSLPIVRELGLEIHREWRSEEEEISVAELKPVMPFWIDVDLSFQAGTNLAWRCQDGIWKDGSGAQIDPLQSPASGDESPLFNNAVTSAIEAITGPFQFTGTTIRVLPLLAHRKRLQEFLDDVINKAIPAQVRLSVWARPPVGDKFAYVYLTASSFAGVTSKSNNVGDWGKYELAFMIPVKYERKVKNKWELESVGLVPAFFFVDDCIAAISRSEVQGIDARTATFVRPESVWLQEGESQVSSNQTVLRVDAQVWPALGAGQEATIQPVIEISQDPSDELTSIEPPDARYQWVKEVRRELKGKKETKANFPKCCKVARALALELLGNQAPINLYTLKQFGDVQDPGKACYQELLRIPRKLEKVVDVREIEESTLEVHIHDYPSLKIKEILGLVATSVDAGGAGLVYCARAIRPFYIRGTMEEPLAEIMSCLRSEDDSLSKFAADRKAEDDQDRLDPSRIKAVMDMARRRRADRDAEPKDETVEAQSNRSNDETPEKNGPAPPPPAISQDEARMALGNVDPQIVIESALSREWGSADENARWRKGRQELLDLLTSLPQGDKNEAPTVSGALRKKNDQLALRAGSVPSIIPPESESLRTRHGSETAQAMPHSQFLDTVAKELDSIAKQKDWDGWQEKMSKVIISQETFTELRLEMERNFNMVASFAELGLPRCRFGEADLNRAVRSLLESLDEINRLKVEGEPSEETYLDQEVAANKSRLKELLKALNAKFPETPQADFRQRADLSQKADPSDIRAHFKEFRQVVALARKFCEAQREALLNKLSRAYQKPDFCIRRDTAGPERDSLLPIAESWDEDWYYGKPPGAQRDRCDEDHPKLHP